MSSIVPSKFLRAVLVLDAASSAALGLLGAAGASLLAGPLGLPELLLRTAGFVLLPWAALVAFIATRAIVRPAVVWLIIGTNVVWAIDSFGLLFGTQVTPTTLGIAFVIAQAVAVLALAECEFVGLRQTRANLAVVA